MNLGDDVTYSGTVSAAFEGTLTGISSVAISQEIETGFTFDAAAEFAARLARHLLDQPLPAGTLVNVNVPAGAPRGVRVVRQGKRRYGEAVIEKKDPRGPAVLLDRRDAADGATSSRGRTSRRWRKSSSR